MSRRLAICSNKQTSRLAEILWWRCTQEREPGPDALEWEWRIGEYAALAEGFAAWPHHTDIEFMRVSTAEAAAAVVQHAQEWLGLLLEAFRTRMSAYITVAIPSSSFSLRPPMHKAAELERGISLCAQCSHSIKASLPLHHAY